MALLRFRHPPRSPAVSRFAPKRAYSGQVNLTPKDPNDVDTAWMSRAPSWSKNGQRIYFTSFRPDTQGDTEIFVMNADGTDVQRLTRSAGVDAHARAR